MNALRADRDAGQDGLPPDEAHKAEREAIRVKVKAIYRLSELMSRVNQLLQEEDAEHATRESGSTRIGLIENLVRETERELRAIQKVSFGALFSRLPRVVHDLAGELGKSVRLITRGESLVVDRNIFDKIADPLIHMVRNSIDHGIEPPGERTLLGKSAEGTIEIDVQLTESQLMVEIRDDGKGLDIDRIKARAVRSGLIRPDEALLMSDERAMGLIFLPGLSTHDAVSEISGRGVGMDVVKTLVEGELGGRVVLQNRKGVGLAVRLIVPLEPASTRIA